MGARTVRLTVRLLGPVLFGIAAAAHAGSLQLMPTLLTLNAGTKAQGLWLSNTGQTPLSAQVRVFRWTQSQNQDHIDPTDDVISSPPMLTLAAGEKQLVRIVRPDADPTGTAELAYRVLVDELPEPGDQRPGVRFVLRFSVPVFVRPAQLSPPALRASVQVRDGQPHLLIRNAGGEHAQFSAVSLVDAAGNSTLVAEGLLGYVLPGAERDWPLSLSAASLAGRFRIKARVNAQPFEQPVPVETLSR